MKFKRILLAAAALFAVTAISCKKDEPAAPQQEDVLKVAPASLNFTAAGGEQTVTVTASSSWQATTTDEWLTINPANDGKTFKVTAAKNEAPAGSYAISRQGTIKVATSTKNTTVSVNQEGETVVFTVLGDPNPAEFTADGGTLAVKVTYSDEYDIEGITDWIIPANTKATKEDNLSFKIAVNEGDAREATLSFKTKNSLKVQTVVVKQAAKVVEAEVFVVLGDPNPAEFTAEAGTLKVKVDYNVNYRVSIPSAASWITPIATKATKTDNLSYAIAANEGDAREAELTFVAVSGTIHRLTVKQAAGKVAPVEGDKFVLDNAAIVAAHTEAWAYASGEKKITAADGFEWTAYNTFGNKDQKTIQMNKGKDSYVLTPVATKCINKLIVEVNSQNDGDGTHDNIDRTFDILDGEEIVVEEVAGKVLYEGVVIYGEHHQLKIRPNEKTGGACYILSITAVLGNPVALEGIASAADFLAWMKNSERTSEKIVKDIDMSSISAELGALSENLDPGVVLDGQGHTLKNWNCARPLFVSNYGTIKDLVIDKTCVLTVRDGYSAFLAEKNDVKEANGGIISGVTNNADISFEGEHKNQLNFGALVSVNYCIIKDCVNNGNISLKIKNTAGANKPVYIGAFAGYFNNSTPIKKGVPDGEFSFVNCTNNGKLFVERLSVSGTVNGDGKSAGNTLLGGIVGATSCGEAASATYRGAIKNCFNYGDVTYQLDEVANGTYAKVGGIVGCLEGSLYGCTNKGTVTITNPNNCTSNSTSQAAGGITGWVRYNIEDCINEGEVVMDGSFGAGSCNLAYAGICHNPSMAGVAAQAGGLQVSGSNSKFTVNMTSLMTDCAVKNCHNKGKVTYNGYMQAANQTEFYVGGVVAFATAAVSNCSNTGLLSGTLRQKVNRVGGVIGMTYNNVTDCTNSGEIVLNQDPISQNGNYQYMVGGVVSHVNFAGTEYKNLANTAKLSAHGDTKAASSAYSYIGGVFANIGKAVTIENCVNSGDLSNTELHYIRMGGVAGCTSGKMKNCSNSGNLSAFTGKQGASSYPVAGGIVAHSGCSENTGCINTGNISVVANVPTHVGLAFGAIGNSTQAWDGGEYGGEITVTGDKAANSFVGLLTGGLCGDYATSNTTSFGLSLGVNEKITVKKEAKINGVAATAADMVKEKLCGNLTTSDAQSVSDKVILGEVVLEGAEPTAGTPGLIEDYTGETVVTF